MGRIGDGDVHAAYVEFRAKESDKVLPPSMPSIPPSLPSRHLSFLPGIKSHYHYSVFRRNVSTVNLSAQKIPLANDNTSSNAPTTSVQ